jgi:hypothetical protein
MSKEFEYIKKVMKELQRYRNDMNHEIFGIFLTNIDTEILKIIIDEIIPYYEQDLTERGLEDATKYYASSYFEYLRLLMGLVHYKKEDKKVNIKNLELLNEKKLPHKILKMATNDYEKMDLNNVTKRCIKIMLGLFNSDKKILHPYIESNFAKELITETIAGNAQFCEILEYDVDDAYTNNKFQYEEFEKVFLESIADLHPMSKSRFVRNAFNNSDFENETAGIPLIDMIKKSKDERIKKAYLEQKLKT